MVGQLDSPVGPRRVAVARHPTGTSPACVRCHAVVTGGGPAFTRPRRAIASALGRGRCRICRPTMETASSLRDPHASDRCTEVQPAAGVLCSARTTSATRHVRSSEHPHAPGVMIVRPEVAVADDRVRRSVEAEAVTIWPKRSRKASLKPPRRLWPAGRTFEDARRDGGSNRGFPTVVRKPKSSRTRNVRPMSLTGAAHRIHLHGRDAAP